MIRRAAILLVLCASAAAAQRVSGVVRASGTNAPIAGAVVSITDSAGANIARMISDERGRYSLSWAARSARMRVVRIGFRPTTVQLPVGASRDTALDVVMERVPPLLETVRVSSDAVCSDSPDRRAALDVWDQARAGLLAAIVAREANPARVTNLTFARRVDPNDKRVNWQRTQLTSGTSTRPFVAARPASAFAAAGYLTIDRGEQVFFAPDADVLFDDSFAAVHCFRVQRDDAHRGQIGLAFEPRVERGRDTLVDVRGVLWMDATVPALTQLDFRFTGILSVAERAGAGGALHFQSMPNGVVFIDDWTMILPLLRGRSGQLVSMRRMPADDPPRRASPFDDATVVDLSASGGVVLSAAWPDGTRWSAPISGVRGRITERGTGKPIPRAIVAVDGAPDTATTDTLGRFVLAPLPPGRYALRFADTAYSDHVRPRTAEGNAQLARGDTANVDVALASRAAVIADLCKDQRAPAQTSTILGRITDGTGEWPRNLAIESTWLAGVAISSMTTVTQGKQRIDVDDAGRFHVCGVARERPVRMRALAGQIPFADTSVTLAGNVDVRAIDWRVRPGLLAAAASGTASLAGRVVRADDGSPIADADVWVVVNDVHVRTDSTGSFQIFGLRTGTHLIQVRHIGFGVLRESLTLSVGQETPRQFAMQNQATVLDTVRTTAEGSRYISPALRGFEERRKTGFGHFIAEDDLRKNEDRSMQALLLSRIPGVLMIPYKSATYVASQRGGAGELADPTDKRSPRACWVTVFLDGIMVYDGPPSIAPDFSRMPVRDYGAVEFYAGAATLPPQFNSTKKMGCGTLLLWTRER